MERLVFRGRHRQADLWERADGQLLFLLAKAILKSPGFGAVRLEQQPARAVFLVGSPEAFGFLHIEAYLGASVLCELASFLPKFSQTLERSGPKQDLAFC